MSTATPSARRRASIWLEFLGSMNLAITLLVALAVSSVVGTVLQQNKAYESYIIKFGPFWFEVYKALGLYDVYSAGWFVFVLGFLLVSTSLCVYRNAPGFVREMRDFRLQHSARSLRAFAQHGEWAVALNAEALIAPLENYLRARGFRVRIKPQGAGLLLAGMKGAANRVGYILTHVAVVVICIGGLLDGNLPLKIKEWRGEVRLETKPGILIADVPQESRLPVSNPSYRGGINIPEGASTRDVILRLRDGYFVQALPFEIAVKDFRIEFYDNGQPKSFESDLVLIDPEREEPLVQTISVNRPLLYKNFAIYQSSFTDGGSRLSLRAWPLGGGAAMSMEGVVGGNYKLTSPEGALSLELTDFRLHNVKTAPPGSGKKFADIGPSFIFKLRNERGEALEFENYMLPLNLDGRGFYMSGVRSNENLPFSPLRIPVDAQGGVAGFMRFHAALRDPAQRVKAAQQVASAGPAGASTLGETAAELLERFAAGGFAATQEYIRTKLASLPSEQREQVARAYITLLQNSLYTLYMNLDLAQATDAGKQQQFFQDAVDALGALPEYGAPFYFELADFNQLQASGLQITRTPGKGIVYLGFGMIVIGVFVMFYLPQRRVWLALSEEGGQTRVLLAGASNRDPLGFAREFELLRDGLTERLQRL
ncbi:MAG: cytochrome c biogenesis protein ResB [Gammaproteobacteria bacterium]|nr:cytochrome c biogenesis protein ResB [Gammaproteobacteria bacterium]